MDSETDRNPSPPPEILNNEDLLPDRIGESIYSKRWLYQTLMSIVQECEKPLQETREAPILEGSFPFDSITNAEENTGIMEIETDIIELDSKIEEDACTLWDMSASRDVAEFLNETGVPNIIHDIVKKTKSPRLLEIVIGILGNMSSFDTVCKSISENKELVCTVVRISGSSDTPTLLQVFRVILCGVRNQNSQALWFQAFDENSIFFDNLKFIFKNSLICDVITGTFQVLHSILNENVQYCKMWGQDTFLNSIIEAANQLLMLEECLDNFFSVLNSVCQYTPNVDKLVDLWKELNLLFNPYFLSLDEEEPLPDRSIVTAIFSCFDTYNSILKSPTMKRELVTIDVKILKSMRRLACSVNSMVLNVRKDNMEVVDVQNPSNDPGRQFLKRIENRQGRQCITMMTEYEFHSWAVLGDVIVETAKILKTYAEKETEKEILEEIINTEVVRENIGVLII